MYSLSQLYFDHGIKSQNYVCNGCHDLTMLCLNLNNIASITVKGVDNRSIIHDISQSEAIHLLENLVLHDRGYDWNVYQGNQY